MPEEDLDDQDDAALATETEKLNLETQPPPSLVVVVEPPTSTSTSSETEPLVFLSSSTSDPLLTSSSSELSSPTNDSPTAGSGWDLDPNEPLHSLSFAPPLADESTFIPLPLNTSSSSSSATPTTAVGAGDSNANLLDFDDGGWGVSPALLIDPIKALFPSSSSPSSDTKSTYLTHPQTSYNPLHSQLSLLRIVSTSLPPSLASHELRTNNPQLGVLILEPWGNPESIPAPFGEIIALEATNRAKEEGEKTVAPKDAFVSAEEGEDGGGGERIGVWVEEEAVKGKVRAGMGIFGRFVWVGREEEEGEGEGLGGFWFVDIVENLIAEVSSSLFHSIWERERY